jgi:hypothetical protein
MAQAKHDSITRRTLLSGAAAIPAMVVSSPVVAAPVATPAAIMTAAALDPIFAAIAAHMRAYDDINAVLDSVAAAEDALDAAKRGTRRAARRRLREARAEEARLGCIESDAIDHLIATVPHTLQGAAAALRYVRERYDEGYPMCEEDTYVTLLASIEQAIGRALDGTS